MTKRRGMPALRRMGGGLLALLILTGLLALYATAQPYVSRFFHPALAPSGANGVALHYIDVGDADSTLVVCEGRAMLVDGGDIGGGGAVIDYLKSQGVERLDYMVGTHPHADHMGGLSEVLQQIDADRFFCPMAESGLGVFRHFQRAVREKGGQIEAAKAGDRFRLGGATVTVESPDKTYKALNDMSLVLRIEYKDVSFLIEGDAQIQAELDMVAGGRAKKADVLRVGHHGSGDSSAAEYLAKVKPKYAVISCGPANLATPISAR